MAMTDSNLNLDDEELYSEEGNLEFEDLEGEDKPWLRDPLDNSDPEPPVDDPDNQEPQDPTDPEESILVSYLKSKGINPDSIKFTNEKGEIEESNFDSLSREEQLEILGYSDTQEDDLREDEIELLNTLRTNNLTIQEYLDAIKRQGIQEYLNNESKDSTYDVDNYTDEELYILDKKTRIPDLSDEDIQQALEHAKANPILFDKEIASLRNEYKQLEQQRIEQEQKEFEANREARAKEFEETITNAIIENSELDFGDTVLALSEDDMQEIASFILDSDAAGIRYIEKALSDPKTLVQMSWYALKGQDAISQISDYYKAEIKKVAQYNYELGLREAKKGNQSKPSTKVSKEPKQTEPKENKDTLELDDLYSDDF